MSMAITTTTITTTPYTIVMSDTAILVNAIVPISIVLPTGSAASNGRSYIIKDISGNSGINSITITTSDGRLIDGHAKAMLNSRYSYLQLISNGSNWYTI